jgi:hypothetical protein
LRRLKRSKEADCALATLYNNLRLNGNAYLFFFLIVFTSAMLCAWKTRVLLWIPGLLSLAEKIEGVSHPTVAAKATTRQGRRT